MVRQLGGCRIASRDDIHAPGTLPLRSLPQPMGAGSSWPPRSASSADRATRTGRRSGCKGEKPWHLTPEKRPRERPCRSGKPTANDDATPAPQARVEDGAVEQTVQRRGTESSPFRHATFAKLLKNEDGATAIEYGLIAALIAVAAVTVMSTVGTNLSTTFNTVAGKL